MNERDLFMATLQIEGAAERSAYLDRACAGEAALRQRVEALLAAFEQAGSFLQQPAGDPRAMSDVARPGPSSASDPAEGPGTVLGPYKLLEPIGEGGMGRVWMAQQTEPVKRLVAVKLIKAGMDSRQVIARFEAERQALALLDHPNIARVLDGGTTSAGRPYFAMDLVKGVPITRYCDEHHLTPRRRLELFIPVCQAVQHAHQKGIIHRDLKPSNVLVAPYDGQPVPKVIDFGVAKAAGQPLTEQTLVTGFGAIVGTLEYMSPEQAEINQLDIDTRSDIYSLGVLLYELLTGGPPFSRKEPEKASMLEMLRVIREQEPSKPSTKLSTAEGLPTLAANRGTEPAKLTRLVRGELDWIVMKALEKDRNRRYDSANGFAMDVQRYLADEPVQACPPSPWYRMQKFVRRNKRPLGMAAALLLAMVVAVASLAVMLQQEIRNRNDLEAALRREQRESYFQLIASAYGEILAHNPGRGEELLDECPPRQGQPDLRGWEWHYLRRMRHGSPFELAHEQEVRDVAFSPDGKRLVSGSFDGTVRVWDTATQKDLHRLPAGSRVFGVAFHPDGRQVAAASEDGLVRVWDLGAAPELAVLRGHEGSVRTVAFGPDGRHLASGGDDATVRLWALESKEPAAVILRGHAAAVWGLAFSPDGRRLASAGFDETVRVWDPLTGAQVLTYRGHTEAVNAVTFSPDGRHLASAGFDQVVRIWDAGNGQEVHRLHGHTLLVYGVAFSPDGQRLVSGGFDKTVKLWDTVTGREILTLHGHKHVVDGVAFSPDGGRLASAGREGVVRLWDARPLPRAGGDAKLAVLSGHAGLVFGVAFSPDGRRLASTGWDGTARLFDVAARQEVNCLRGHRKAITGLAYSPDGRWLATSGWDRTIRLWDAATGAEVRVLKEHTGLVDSVAFSPDGTLLASCSTDTTVRLWDVATGQQRGKFGGHAGMVISVTFSGCGAYLLAGVNDGSIRTWSIASGKEQTPLSGHSGPVFGLAVSPDGQCLASASIDGTVKLWDLAARRELHTFRGEANTFTKLAFHRDGKHLAAANTDAVLVWDTETRERVATLRAHRGTVWAVAFSPDGRRLATGSGYREFGEVKVWEWDALAPRVRNQK
jgi:WD40 repeat protein/serine/threonine protein kinase